MNTVLFDPGFSGYVSSFMYFNEDAMKLIKSLKAQQQRAFRFRQLLPQIMDIMKREVGFYYACLLWASFIKYSNENDPKEISNNGFYGHTKEELEQFDYLQEVNYLLNFFEQYKKNLNFYKISAPEIDEKYIKTVEIYKEFLIINESFINTKTTADLKLPTNLKPVEKKILPTIESLITQTVQDGNFERLFEIKIF